MGFSWSGARSKRISAQAFLEAALVDERPFFKIPAGVFGNLSGHFYVIR